MKIVGKEPIHPLLFYSGKGAGYTTWVLFLLSGLDVIHIGRNPVYWLVMCSFALLAVGVFLSMVSIVNLGSSTRLGLPTEKTTLKSNGLYRYSRNPMYLGFNLMTVSSAIYHANVLIVLFAVFSIGVYHWIIRAEERYMQEAFGVAYEEYLAKARRYV